MNRRRWPWADSVTLSPVHDAVVLRDRAWHPNRHLDWLPWAANRRKLVVLLALVSRVGCISAVCRYCSLRRGVSWHSVSVDCILVVLRHNYVQALVLAATELRVGVGSERRRELASVWLLRVVWVTVRIH